MFSKKKPPPLLQPPKTLVATDYAKMGDNQLLEELFKYSRCYTQVKSELVSQIVKRISIDYTLVGIDCIKGEGAIVAVKNQLGKKRCLKIIKPNLAKKQAIDIRNEEDIQATQDINKYKKRLFEGIKIQEELYHRIKKSGAQYFSIPEVFGIFTKPFLYIEQEWIEGVTILNYLNSVKDLTKSLEIFKLLLDGIELYVHSYGIIHRDIKADNIMIAGDKESEFFLYLLDFSLTKPINREDLTVVGEGIGTPFYADYDQLEGKEAVYATYQSDIYSLGLVLWEFIACRKIPILLSVDEMKDKKRRAEYINVLVQDIPKPLRGVFLNATAQKEHRYQTVSEFKSDYVEAITKSIDSVDFKQYECETKKYIEIDDYGETEANQEVIVDSVVDKEIDICKDCTMKEDSLCRKYQICNKKLEVLEVLKG